ncbi:MAG: hypothetical protein AB9882_08140 [Ignavibacteriaceae bacterium]
MKARQLFYIFILLSGILQCQEHIAVYDRIPLYVFPWSLDSLTTQIRIQTIKDMGCDGVLAQEVRAVLFDRLNTAGLKIILYNAVNDSPFVNYIAKYTDASYTEWEAEGTDISFGNLTVKYNSNISETLSSGGVTWVRTYSGAGGDTLIKGPGYFQSLYYIIEPGSYSQKIRNYEAEFILKTDTNPLLSPEEIEKVESDEDTVCILRVTYNPHPLSQNPITIDSAVIRLSDLKPYGDIKSKTIEYNLAGLQESIAKTLSSPKEDNYGSPAARFLEYRVEWKGLNYVRLWIDKVIVSDDRGRELIVNKIRDQYIRWQANDSFFAYPVSKFDSTIVGWYAVDEPSSIDNSEPLKYIDNLIKNATNGKKQLVFSLAGSFSGWFYADSAHENEKLYRVEEILKRSGIKSVVLNYYPYNLPYIEDKGIYKANVDMSRFSSGVYIYRIITPDYSLSKKMILIK